MLLAGDDGRLIEAEEVNQVSLKEQVEALITAGEKPNAAIKKVAAMNHLKKQEVYRQFHELDA